VYTGGYLVRNVDQVGDYTNYARGVYADYYQCNLVAYDATLAPHCYSPRASWRTTERNTHIQHEFRLSTPDDWRARGILGAYWENNTLYDVTSWMYKACRDAAPRSRPAAYRTSVPSRAPPCSLSGRSPITPRFIRTRCGRPSSWRSSHRPITTLSQGADLYGRHASLPIREPLCRQRDIQLRLLRGGHASRGCHNPAYSFNLNAQDLSDTETGWKSRANLTWHVMPDVMVYYTFSQGFRPGGFNQNSAVPHALGCKWCGAILCAEVVLVR